MKLTPELLEAWKDAAERAIDHGHPIDWSVERKPKHIIRDLIADLEEAKEQLASPYMDGYEAAKEEYRPQIIAAEADRDHWRANHDNVVAKLRLFTQREDLPVDRLPAYEYVKELEKKLAEANNRERLISKNLDFERELHAKTEAELAATRKQLAESERRYSESVGGFKRDLQQKLDDQRSKNVRLKAKIAEAQDLIEAYRKDAERWREYIKTLKSSVGLDGINVCVSAQRNDGSIYAIHHAIRPWEYINDEMVAERVGQRLSHEIIAAIAAAKGGKS